MQHRDKVSNPTRKDREREEDQKEGGSQILAQIYPYNSAVWFKILITFIQEVAKSGYKIEDG